ncbi:hypothetical protein PIROE2DRAFT_16373 [Piromyces sp. E2]|nr:hypothetical protein PIROE2DRAFT_16373 [Piromyces sp. E2]|eukprot:OUM58366.1 hypothetical protein PIROE2DRAFT_16373 [Piromyces sp. E2]
METVDLRDNGLSGAIPESIGKLTNLTKLNLSGNNLSGPIPESIGNLTELTTLELSNNNISGTIPNSIINLTKLTKNLSRNPLSGKIPNLKNNTKLTSCQLTNTNVCYIGEEKNFRCKFSSLYSDCSKCVDNASLIDGVCQCNNGYSGFGYMYCHKENEIDSIMKECKVVNEIMGLLVQKIVLQKCKNY